MFGLASWANSRSDADTADRTGITPRRNGLVCRQKPSYPLGKKLSGMLTCPLPDQSYGGLRVKRLFSAALTVGILAAGLLTTALPAQASSASAAPTGSASADPTSASPAPSGPTVSTAPGGSPAAGSAGPGATTAPTLAKDTTPPGPITDLGLTGNTISSVTLGWTDPTDADLAHVIVRRATGSTPPATGQGTLVATLGASATSYTDKSLAT
jgi:hypothetical protein